MAIARQTDEKYIRPLYGSTTIPITLGATTVAGEVVSMQSDGKCDPADTTSAAQQMVGVVLKGGSDGDKVDVVIYGPVSSITGGTPGSTVHATDTAGEPGESAGSNAGVVGFVKDATTLFVRPTTA